MNFLPGRSPDETVIRPDAFDAPIEVRGIAPAMMAGLFHGASDARGAWRAGLAITAALAAGGDESVETAQSRDIPYQNDLPDGLALLHSGAPGTVRVESRHALGELLLPQSLYLLLAQQWARAGLMLVHGAVFEFEGRGILALGDKGAGKSVLTMAALAAGAQVISDDWVMLGIDREGRLKAERLREFLMLRLGQAHDLLTSRLNGIKSAPLKMRPKSVFHFRDQPEHIRRQCISTCTVDQLWLLQRPRSGRFQPSTSTVASPVQALAALIQATMPILFSRRFAPEAAKLKHTTDVAFSGNRLYTVRTGPDLLDDPARVLASLL